MNTRSVIGGKAARLRRRPFDSPGRRLTARDACLACAVALLLAGQSPASRGDGASLVDAARTGDLEGVQRLVVDGADVNARGVDGDTPLVVAALNGHADIVNYLLQRGADVNAPNRNGLTPLHAAAYAGHSGSAALLIAKGAQVNNGDNRFAVRPLHLAAEEDQLDVARLLLDHGADPHAPEANGYTAISRAGWREHWDVLELLLARGAICQDADTSGEWLYGECTRRAAGR